MSEASRGSRVTISLGRSGQVVRDGCDLDDELPRVGTKRSVKERLGKQMDIDAVSKRQRGEASFSGNDLQISQNDLRFKLMQRRTQSDGGSTMDLREKLLSKSEQPPPPRSLDSRPRMAESRDVMLPPSRTVRGPSRMLSSSSYHSPRNLDVDDIGRRSPERLVGRSPPRNGGSRAALSPPRNTRSFSSGSRVPLSPPRDTGRRSGHPRDLSPPRDDGRRSGHPRDLSPPRHSHPRDLTPPRNSGRISGHPRDRSVSPPRHAGRLSGHPRDLSPPRTAETRVGHPRDRSISPPRHAGRLSGHPRDLSPPRNAGRVINHPRDLSPLRNASSFSTGYRTLSPTRNVGSSSYMSSSRGFSPPRHPGSYMGSSMGSPPPSRNMDDFNGRSRMLDDLRASPYGVRGVLNSQAPANVTTFSRPMLPPPPVPNPHMLPPLSQLPPFGSVMHNSPFPVEEPLTVDSFLHSLGLGRYSLNFKREEVDMTTIKQMKESDLKDLTIPMGPRKTILQAIACLPKY